MGCEKKLVALVLLVLFPGFGNAQTLTSGTHSISRHADCTPTTIKIAEPHLVSEVGKPPLYNVIRNKEDWRNLTHMAFYPPDLKPPVDFKKEMLVVFTYMAQSGHRINRLKIDKACALKNQYRVEYTLHCYTEKQKGPIHIVSGVRRFEALAVILPQSPLQVFITGKVNQQNGSAPTPVASGSDPKF
jgi:hypothetical protein